MKIETKIKRVVNSLVENNNFSVEEAEAAVSDTMEYFDLAELSIPYFLNALLITYNVEGVER